MVEYFAGYVGGKGELLLHGLAHFAKVVVVFGSGGGLFEAVPVGTKVFGHGEGYDIYGVCSRIAGFSGEMSPKERVHRRACRTVVLTLHIFFFKIWDFMRDLDFESAFKAIMCNLPFPWQKRLFQKFIQGNFPQCCNIPTGLGKTSIIALWVLALARQKDKVPRRLVYVVNRRTIVDQSTKVVEDIVGKLSRALGDSSSDLHYVARGLRDLNAEEGNVSDNLLSVSTLRGQMADNKHWKENPAVPSIIVGTVDKIGSKLLFCGYGDSANQRPIHAGLLGVDCLFIHDEAHLTPAFGKLLRTVQKYTKRYNRVPGFRVMELSATHSSKKGEFFGLDKDDRDDKIIHQRINAGKSLYLEEKLADNRKLRDAVVDKSWDFYGEHCRVVIFVRKPDDAEYIFSELEKKIKESGVKKNKEEERKEKEVFLRKSLFILTGRIRGYERDELMKKPGMQSFLGQSEKPEHTVYLVSTSAGEVGMDLNADHMVCDLSPMLSMIQRLGRVNRFGNNESSKIHVFFTEEPKGKEKSTLEFLKRKKNDQNEVMASIHAIQEWQKDCDYPKTLDELVETVPLQAGTLDLWSMTSIKSLCSRPEVRFWLHGINGDEPPETYLVWRDEVNELAKCEPGDIEEWFKKHPVSQRERVIIPTEKIKKKLDGLKKERDKENSNIILIDQTNSIHVNELDRDMDYATLVLPAEAGGLDPNGFLVLNKLFNPPRDKKALLNSSSDEPRNNPRLPSGNKKAPELDISHKLDQQSDGSQFIKGRLFLDDNCWKFHPWPQREEARILEASDFNESIKELKNLYTDWEDLYKIPCSFTRNLHGNDDSDEERTEWLILLKKQQKTNRQQSGTGTPNVESTCTPTVEKHNQDVKEIMEKILSRLDLQADIKEALVKAAACHDEGKANTIWQEAIKYKNGSRALAKGKINGFQLNGFRHESESMVKAQDEVRNHPQRDLILHLIASHHGRARPCFESRAFDPSSRDTKEINLECMKRFERLQREWGWWGLAWLETLLRRADAIASAREEDIET